MIELNDFYNNGSGWICKRCESELALDSDPGKHQTSVNAALAKWMDNTRCVLICPRCGITEPVEKS